MHVGHERGESSGKAQATHRDKLRDKPANCPDGDAYAHPDGPSALAI